MDIFGLGHLGADDDPVRDYNRLANEQAARMIPPNLYAEIHQRKLAKDLTQSIKLAAELARRQNMLLKEASLFIQREIYATLTDLGYRRPRGSSRFVYVETPASMLEVEVVYHARHAGLIVPELVRSTMDEDEEVEFLGAAKPTSGMVWGALALVAVANFAALFLAARKR